MKSLNFPIKYELLEVKLLFQMFNNCIRKKHNNESNSLFENMQNIVKN